MNDENLRRFQEKYEHRVLPYYQGGRFGEFQGARGARLRYACFQCKAARAALVLFPGKGESYLKYAELFYDLRELKLSIYAADHRGMGFSGRLTPDRLKIHVESFNDYLEDTETFLQTVVRPPRQVPLLALGHSLGGLIAARYVQLHPGEFRAAVLCSPLLQIHTGPLPGFAARPLAVLLDRPSRASAYGPGQRHRPDPSFPGNRTTHSFPRWSLWERRTMHEHPELRRGGVSNHWIGEVMAAGSRAMREAAQVSVPLLILQAGQDRIVDTAAQRRFCRRAPRCRSLFLAEARHEILIEREELRSRALAAIREFLTTPY